MQFLLQSENLYNFPDKCPVNTVPVQLDGESDVFLYIQNRDEIVALEDETDLPSAENTECVVFQFEDVFAIHDDLTGCGAVQTAQHMKQRGFAGTGSADNGGELALPKGDGHPGQRADLCLAASIVFFQISCLKDCFHKLSSLLHTYV